MEMVQFYEIQRHEGVSLWHGFQFLSDERTEKIVFADLDSLLSPCRFGNICHFINKYFFGSRSHKNGKGQKFSDKNLKNIDSIRTRSSGDSAGFTEIFH